MSWKDRACAAADLKATQDEAAKRVRDEAEREKQIEAFGWALTELLEEEITVDGLEATIDGVTFGWHSMRLAQGYGIVVRGKCPNCPAQAWSPQIRSLDELGRQLQHFTPDSAHQHQLAVQDYVRVTPLMERHSG